MITRMQRVFALSESGARSMRRTALWAALSNLALMIPPTLVAVALKFLLPPLTGGVQPSANLWLVFVVMSIAALAVIYATQYVLYGATFVSTYKESANRRTSLAEKLRRLPLSFFGKRDLSDLTTTIMSDCNELEQLYSHAVPQLLGAAISTTIIALGLLIFDWRMGLAVIWVLPLSLLTLLSGRKIQVKYNAAFHQAQLADAEAIQEGLETFRTVKICCAEQRFLDGLKNKLDGAERLHLKSELTASAFIFSSQAILKLGLASTLLVGGWLMSRGLVDLWVLVVYLMVAAQLYDPISAQMIFLAHLMVVSEPIRRTREIESQPTMDGRSDWQSSTFDLVFSHVSFGYGREPVLHDVSFVARQGEVTALVGPSGGGKSTSARLAARFWDVNTGKITLGGTDLREIAPEYLLSFISIVFQEVVLFDETVMENIRLGRHGATDDEVLAAARSAQCDDFVSKLPQGYETRLGENGQRLSGGERQRISIARAILKDAPLVILDEATASLDAGNETAVQAAIAEMIRNKTVLVIAHRLRTVANADHLVVLADGRVVEQGTPAELMAADGFFAAMARCQTDSSGWSIGLSRNS